MKLKVNWNKRIFIFAIILALFRTGSMLFYMNDLKYSDSALGIEMICGITVLRFIFYLVLFYEGMMWIDRKISSVNVPQTTQNTPNNSSKILLKDYMVYAIAWMIPLLIKYPGAIQWDTWALFEEFRTGNITTFHSVFYMVIMGNLVGVFESLGYPNFGLYLFVFLHYLVYVLIFGYSVNVLRKIGASDKSVFIYRLITIFNPYIMGYIGVAIKDTVFALYIMGVCILMAEYYWTVNNQAEGDIFKPYKFVFMATMMVLACLTRKNGIYIFALTFLILLVIYLKKKSDRMIILTYLIAIVAYCVLSFGLNHYYQAAPGSIREAFSLPFQQTARYAKMYDDEVTDEEREAIDGVLSYEKIRERYNPRISDPVKGKYKENKAALPAYFKVWLKQFFKHPMCYVAATWEQNYYMFVPEAEVENIALFQDIDNGYELGEHVIISEQTDMYEDIFSVPDRLKKYQQWIVDWFYELGHLPIVGYVWNLSVSVYALFIIQWIFSNYFSGKDYSLLPMWGSLLSAIAGPAIQGHPRYLFMIMYSIPFFTIYAIVNSKKKA